MIHRKLAGLGLMLAVVLAVGCGDSRTVPTAKVTGVVKLDGTPVDKADVVFYPTEGRQASGMTNAQGEFTLSTFETGDGAVLGHHGVAVMDGMISEEEGGEMDGTEGAPTEEKSRFPGIYSSDRTSGFSAEVTENEEDNHFVFDMKSE
ncbi:MAG: hypothetical protein ACYTG0_06550 [Planctomycetota bacterium]|jgi:hypothetical protein